MRMKSPIAPPRITRMRFIAHCSDGSWSAETMIECLRRDRRSLRLILRKREPENHATVNQRDSVQTPPAKNAARAPINLIAKDVRNCDPEQTGDNQQVSKHCYEQAARFVTQKGRIKQRFGREQTKNSKSAYREKFVHEKQTRVRNRLAKQSGADDGNWRIRPSGWWRPTRSVQARQIVSSTIPATRERGNR